MFIAGLKNFVNLFAKVAVMTRVCALLLAVLLMSAGVASAQDTVIYYHTDAVGSVRMITDANGGVLARYDFEPFGVQCGSACGTGTPPETIQFAGKERDADTTFDYFGARYYASQTGRLTAVDPVLDIESSLEDPQRWNRYAYALNNPLRYKDEDGRIPIPVIVAGVTAFAASPAGQRAIVAGSAFLQRYGAQLQRVALTQGQAISNEVFALAPLVRGKVIDSLLGTAQRFANFPVIDDFVNGTAISRKSIDVFAQSYQRGNALFSKLAGYVDDLAGFPGGAQGGVVVPGQDIRKRVLEIIVPKGGIKQYQDIFRRLVDYSRREYRDLEIIFKEAAQ
jgi:RHS repeat-associated protein